MTSIKGASVLDSLGLRFLSLKVYVFVYYRVHVCFVCMCLFGSFLLVYWCIWACLWLYAHMRVCVYVSLYEYMCVCAVHYIPLPDRKDKIIHASPLVCDTRLETFVINAISSLTKASHHLSPSG